MVIRRPPLLFAERAVKGLQRTQEPVVIGAALFEALLAPLKPLDDAPPLIPAIGATAKCVATAAIEILIPALSRAFARAGHRTDSRDDRHGWIVAVEQGLDRLEEWPAVAGERFVRR